MDVTAAHLLPWSIIIIDLHSILWRKEGQSTIILGSRDNDVSPTVGTSEPRSRRAFPMTYDIVQSRVPELESAQEAAPTLWFPFALPMAANIPHIHIRPVMRPFSFFQIKANKHR